MLGLPSRWGAGGVFRISGGGGVQTNAPVGVGQLGGGGGAEGGLFFAFGWVGAPWGGGGHFWSWALRFPKICGLWVSPISPPPPPLARRLRCISIAAGPQSAPRGRDRTTPGQDVRGPLQGRRLDRGGHWARLTTAGDQRTAPVTG